MAVQIPTLSELYTDILSNLETELNISIPLFGKVFLRAWAAVLAAKIKLYYLAIANLQKNMFVDLADPESIGGTLERFGRVKLGREPFPAQAGVYGVDITGDIGSVIKANTTWKSNDDSASPGKLFILDSAYTIVAGVNTVQLRALEAGVESQLVVNDQLTATAPIANVDQVGVVSAEITTPLAQEDLEDYRNKAIEAYQLEPQGGAGTDYRLWSADAQGVRKVYPYVKVGYPNEIEIFVEATVVDSVDGMGTPSQSILDDVRDVIEFDPDVTKPLNERGRRPLGLFNVDLKPITVLPIDITVTGYDGLTPAKQTSIENAINNFVNTVRPFVASADILADRNDIISVNNLTFVLLEAVPGSIFVSLEMSVDGDDVPTYLFLGGNIPYLNSITYAI